MKTRGLQRIIAPLCLIAILVTTSACSGDSKNSDIEKQSYTANFLDIPKEVTAISRLLVSEGTAYLCCSESEAVSYLATMDIESGDFQKLPLDMDAGTSMLDFGIDPNGDIWIICADGGGGHSLKKLGSGGKLQQSVDLSAVLDAKIASDTGSKMFLSIDSDGNICVAMKYDNTHAYLFDSQGQFLFELYDDGNLLDTITTAEGVIGICATSADRMNYNLLTVDMDKKAWRDEKVDLGATAGLYGGLTSSFYQFDSSNLYGYVSGAKEKTPILSWSEMGLNGADVHLCELEGGRFVILAASSNQVNELSYELAVLSQGSDDRTVLTMISLSAQPSVLQAVSDFNKRNKEYRIELEEYFPFEYDVSDEDWNNAITKLNTQIISGNIPDILDMSNLAVEIYHNKGLLENLFKYIENDPEINMADYYENVFNAISIGGELPFITNGVGIYTMAANQNILGGSSGWSLDDMKRVIETNGADAIGNLTGEHFLKIMLQTSDGFIDWSAGKCNFNSPEFIELLELAKEVQESGGAESGNYTASYEAVLSAYHVALLNNTYKGGLDFIGLPSGGGKYHAVWSEAKIGISSASEHKDGAWEFVRTLLTEEHQKSCTLLPIHKGAFDTVMQAAIDGKSVWTWVYEGGHVTQKDVDTLEELLGSASYAANVNQTLEEIVLEEAAEYFSGNKTGQEAAEKIQNRANLYINEQM